MNLVYRFLVLFLVFVLTGSFVLQKQNESWIYQREKQGIKVFTKKSIWGKLRDSKAVMQVAATPEQMLLTLTDFDNYKSWVPRCGKSRLLARLNDNEFIAYLYFDAPWPVKNRDCVIRVKIEKNPASGVITLTQTSEPKYIREESDVVRIEQLVSRWSLIPKKEGGATVINEYSSNPGEAFPIG
ncbi:MAG: hypothetical protein IPP77_03065 [Bacteroidetes bacterium]|nr:hypothetical protein [Bacteroidota bacterium]